MGMYHLIQQHLNDKDAQQKIGFEKLVHASDILSQVWERFQPKIEPHINDKNPLKNVLFAPVKTVDAEAVESDIKKEHKK